MIIACAKVSQPRAVIIYLARRRAKTVHTCAHTSSRKTGNFSQLNLHCLHRGSDMADRHERIRERERERMLLHGLCLDRVARNLHDFAIFQRIRIENYHPPRRHSFPPCRRFSFFSHFCLHKGSQLRTMDSRSFLLFFLFFFFSRYSETPRSAPPQPRFRGVIYGHPVF